MNAPVKPPHDEPAHAAGIGIDTGGTHTDLVLLDGEGVVTLKVPSTLGDLSEGVLDGVRQILAIRGVPISDVRHFVYATTMVTNLIVEEAGASVGLIATEGFRDVLEIGRASRKPNIYDIDWRPARPLVPRPLRLAVRERIGHDGSVIEPLDEEGARAVLRRLADAGCTSIAVCLLHSYANPAHEERIAGLAAEECPGIDISLSSGLIREFREYERTSTAALDAFVKRPLTRHLTRLGDELARAGLAARPFIMRGNGGISSFEVAAEKPAALTHSGPMGGIVGGAVTAAACGIRDIITLDMGGTSADVSLVVGGETLMTNAGRLGPYPLLLPMLDLVTIGAGGGSIGWVDEGGAMRVGPRSAGAMPGPACYAQGGADPTVTDANLHAGRLNPDYFLAGRRQLRPDLARAALAGRLADPLSMSMDEAAYGIVAVAESHMVNAIKLMSVDRGLDPRDFTLVAFGGAGPLHAARLAEELSISRVLIPPAPGNTSSLGLLAADVRHDFVRTRLSPLAAAGAGTLMEEFDAMAAEAEATLTREDIPPARRVALRTIELRYEGQNYELSLPVPPEGLDGDSLAALAVRFHEEHHRVYGYRLPERTVQIVNLRLAALGRRLDVQWPRVPRDVRKADEPASRRVLIAPGEWADVPVLRLDALTEDQSVAGPAIVEYPGSTLFVPPGWEARYDERRNAHLERRPPGGARIRETT